jgi:hypothetical protein
MKTTIRGHQGDVIFKTIASLPKEAVKINHKPIALGEHSGHEHIITGDFELFELNGVVYAAIGSDGAMLQHVHESRFNGDYKTKRVIEKADHKPIPLSQGIYEFFIQGSYNPYKKIMEKVID